MKSIILICAVLFGTVCTHVHANNTEIIRHLQARIAFELIASRYPGDAPAGKKYSDFIAYKTKFCTDISKIEEFLGDERQLSKLIEICNKIKSWPTDFSSNEEFWADYSEKTRQIADEKNNKAVEIIIKEIKNTKLSFGETITPSEDFEQDVNNKEIANINEDINENESVRPQIKSHKSHIKNQNKNDDSGGSVYNPLEGVNWSILLPVLSLLILILFVFLYIKTNREKNKYKNICNQISAIFHESEINALVERVKFVYNRNDENVKRITELKRTNNEQLEIIGQKDKEIERILKEMSAKSNVIGPSAFRNSSSLNVSSINTNKMECVEKDLTSTEMYLGLPSDNAFNNVTDAYRAGKTLYKLTYTSNDTAIYEFINKPETIQFARQSRTKFLECACVIENDDVPVFDSIETIEVGKLEKNNDVWEIISKARIRLS